MEIIYLEGRRGGCNRKVVFGSHQMCVKRNILFYPDDFGSIFCLRKVDTYFNNIYIIMCKSAHF